MLLEAGFLDVAMARLEDALAISPNLTAASLAPQLQASSTASTRMPD